MSKNAKHKIFDGILPNSNTFLILKVEINECFAYIILKLILI